MGVHRAIRGQGQVDDAAYVDPSAYVSSSALVSTFAFVDRGAFIGANTYIGLRTIVGAGAHIGVGAFIGADCIICDKARIADGAVIVDGSTVLSDCCCDGGGSGGLDVPVLTFDSINVVGDKLAAYITTGKKKGTLAYVGNDTFAGQFSVHRYYTLVYNEALTADGIEVVNSPTFATDGAQWLSQDTPDQQAQVKLFWAVDPSNVSGVASDENTGWGTSLANAKLHPLLTFKEFNRRMAGMGAGANPTQVALMSNDAATPLLTNIKGQFGPNRVTIIGDMTQVGANYTATAYADAVPAANTGYLLSAVGLGGAGNVGKLVTNQAQTKFAFIMASKSADQALITQPHSYDPTTRTGATTGVVFTVGETLQVWTLPSLSQYPFVGGAQVPALWKCQVNRSSLALSQWDDAGTTLVACSLTNGLYKGADSGVLTGCIFLTTDIAVYDGGGLTFRNCGILNCDINLFAGDYALLNNLTIVGNGSAKLAIGAGATVEMFANSNIYIDSSEAAGAIQLGHGGQLNSYGNNAIFGTGNSNVLNVASQCQATIDTANFFATAIVAPLLVNGINYILASIPIVDLNSDSQCLGL